MTTDLDKLELTAPTDKYYNYCLWDYVPVESPVGKLRPINILLHSFRVGGMSRHAVDVVRAIQREIGPFRTVWGIKFSPAGLAWEFYFYDYKRRERDVSISRVQRAIAPMIRGGVPINEQLPYFMFSLDIDTALVEGRRELDIVHMYMGNPGSLVSSGVSYAMGRDSTALENFYFFFDARKQLSEAAAKIACSPHFDPRQHMDTVLWPRLRACRTICVANKRSCDTAYFSGVDVGQLLEFLESMRYPGEIVKFVRDNRQRLDHLLYDVGFDYVSNGPVPRFIKSGFYGTF